MAGYDNVGTSLLTIFQIVTLSNWSFVMYRTMDSQGDATVLFFLVVIILGTYYIMILFLAVLKTKFGKAQEMYAKAAPAKKNGDNVLVKTYKLVKLSFALLKRRFISRRSSSSSKGSVHAGLEELDADGNDVYVERHIAKPKV